jgi:uncharacterized membrane protein
MTPLRFLGLYGSAMVTFLALDLLWLGVVARGFYANQLGHLMRPDVRWGAAFLFYAIYVLGIVVLAVLPALDAGSLARAAGLGALLGLVAYAAYDLTNMATLAGFPARMVAVDMIWGTVLTAAVASAAFAVGRWMGLG